MKMKRNIFTAIFVAITALASCVRLGDLNLEPVPDIAFTYQCDGGLEYTFMSTVPNTTDISWNVIDVTTGTGETFSCTFPQPGTYWVQMTGTYNGRQQTVSTKILVAKASVVRMDDNTLDDWDGVLYEDFIFTGGSYEGLESPILLESKFDYDAVNVYFYIQFDTNVRDDIDADQHRFDLFLDTDASTSTGVIDFDDRLGVDYILQMHIYDDEDISVMDGGWDDSTISNGEELTGSLVVGHYETTQEGIVRIEFSLPRSVWGITGTKMGFGFKLENYNWTDFDALQDAEGNQGIIVDLNKME